MSRALANEIARRLTEKKQKSVDKLLAEYQKYVFELYEAAIPKEIKKALQLYPHYFRSYSGSIRLYGHGFSDERVSIFKIAPKDRVLDNKDGNAYLEMDAAMAFGIRQKKKEYEDAKKPVDTLFTEIETALIGLGSFAKIQKHLPAAVPFLPKSTSVELMVNLDDLNAKLAVK